MNKLFLILQLYVFVSTTNGRVRVYNISRLCHAKNLD